MNRNAEALRDRLVALRAETVRRLIEALPAVDTGLLALVAHTHAALAVLEDKVERSAAPPPPSASGRTLRQVNLGARVTQAGARQRQEAASVKRSSKPTLDFYGSAEWKALRKAVIAERGKRCQRCSKQGGRVYLDHVVELRDGGAKLDRANVQVLCAGCHTAKTAAARAARQGGRVNPRGEAVHRTHRAFP